MADNDDNHIPSQLEPELREMKLEESNSDTNTILKDEPVNGDAQSPSDLTSTMQTSRSNSKSPVKKSEETQSPASNGPEEVIGGEITVKLDGKTPKLSRSAARKVASKPPVLYNDLDDRTSEATANFTVITDSTFQPKHLGDTEHALECDCAEEWDPATKTNHACGEDSNCINRLTKMECIGDCGCGSECQNRRFQRKDYANVSVIKTEKKGYGLRANTKLAPHDFIFEYIGEVIDERKFKQRTIKYADEGIKHFYFMSLNKGEFVDATKKGNLGRFCNHSCSPNCYVDKWVVNDKFRMGIFAERTIEAGEELVFNYNVDRYGADKTPCYCGEPNCSGYIGGSTQTGGSDPQLSNSTKEALGIEDYEDWLNASTTSKKKKKQKYEENDEEYVGDLQPRGLQKEGVPKVMAALKQVKEEWIAVKVLKRIEDCEDARVIAEVLKIHGYLIMKTVLAAFPQNDEIMLSVLNILDRFPRISRNKIQDSKIEETIQQLTSSGNHRIEEKASALLEDWSKLEVQYRIPRMKADRTATPTFANLFDRHRSERPRSRSKSPTSIAPKAPRGPAAIAAPTGPKGMHQMSSRPQYPNAPRAPRANRPLLPDGWSETTDPSGRTYYFTTDGQRTQWDLPRQPYGHSAPPPPPPKEKTHEQRLQDVLDDIVKENAEKAAAAAAAAPKVISTPKVEDKYAWKSWPEARQHKTYKNALFPLIKHYVDKHKSKLPKEILKHLGKEIADLITESDFRHKRVENPKRIDAKRTKEIRKHVSQWFDRGVLKWQRREKERAERNVVRASRGFGPVERNLTGELPKPAEEKDSFCPPVVDEEDLFARYDAEEKSPGDFQTPSDGSPGLKRKRDGASDIRGPSTGDDGLTSPKKVKTDAQLQPAPPPPPPAEVDVNATSTNDMERTSPEPVEFESERTSRHPASYVKANGSINTLIAQDQASPSEHSPTQLATPSTTTNGSCDRDMDGVSKQENGTRQHPRPNGL